MFAFHGQHELPGSMTLGVLAAFYLGRGYLRLYDRDPMAAFLACLGFGLVTGAGLGLLR